MERVVFGFDELRQEDAERVGKKCANLGELTACRLPGATGLRRLPRSVLRGS